MQPITAVATYFVIWWVVLFAVLPLGTKPVADADPHSGWRGAPERPQLGRKALITTLVSAVIFLAIYLTVTQDWFGLRSAWIAMHEN
jgi:predicted secreted protein